MAARELKIIILVPVLEGEVAEGRGVGELQVSKVPVEDLSVTRGEVHIAGGRRLKFLKLVLDLPLLLHQLIPLLKGSRDGWLEILRDVSNGVIYFSIHYVIFRSTSRGIKERFFLDIRGIKIDRYNE